MSMGKFICPKCGGGGKIKKRKCNLCNGKGFVTEAIVKKRSGKPGRAEYRTTLKFEE